MSSRTDTEDERFDIRRELFEWAQALVVPMVVFVLLFAFVARSLGVQGVSMEPTLHEEDKLLISNLNYTPKHGDVIMFTKRGIHIPDYSDDNPQPLVKRVIGLAGDVIDIDFLSHQVFVNGVALEEPYINNPTAAPGNVNFPVTVPENHIFVMGDNRNVSLDSRNTDVGMVDERCILGHVLFRVYPFNNMGVIK